MRAVLVLALALLGCGAAVAGDSATFAIIGYSRDSRYFAYEQFSIGDDATPPHASVSLLDTYSGEPVSGSPFIAGGSEEAVDSIAALRSDALEMAAEALHLAGIDTPAHYLALIGDGVRTETPDLTFALPQGSGPEMFGAEVTLWMQTLRSLWDDKCTAHDGARPMGYALAIIVDKDDRPLARYEGNEDETICPRDYHLYGIVQPYNGGGLDDLVVILSAYTLGFEGYDRRFVAIPVRPRRTE